MRRLKVTNLDKGDEFDGSPFTRSGRIVDADTGELVLGIAACRIELRAYEQPKLYLEVVDFDIDLDIPKENVFIDDSRKV